MEMYTPYSMPSNAFGTGGGQFPMGSFPAMGYSDVSTYPIMTSGPMYTTIPTYSMPEYAAFPMVATSVPAFETMPTMSPPPAMPMTSGPIQAVRQTISQPRYATPPVNVTPLVPNVHVAPETKKLRPSRAKAILRKRMPVEIYHNYSVIARSKDKAAQDRANAVLAQHYQGVITSDPKSLLEDAKHFLGGMGGGAIPSHAHFEGRHPIRTRFVQPNRFVKRPMIPDVPAVPQLPAPPMAVPVYVPYAVPTMMTPMVSPTPLESSLMVPGAYSPMMQQEMSQYPMTPGMNPAMMSMMAQAQQQQQPQMQMPMQQPMMMMMPGQGYLG